MRILILLTLLSCNKDILKSLEEPQKLETEQQKELEILEVDQVCSGKVETITVTLQASKVSEQTNIESDDPCIKYITIYE